MDLLWLLAFAGLMILMCRFGMGCCGGHAHGGGRGEKTGEAPGKGKGTAA